MSFEAALHALGLRRPHIKLLQFFLTNLGKEYTVREIAKVTEIPVTRVYKVLAELVKLDLIERRVGRKIVFRMTDPEERFRIFIGAQNRQQQEIYKNLLDAVARFGMSSSDIVILRNREELYQAVYQLFLKSKTLKIITRSCWGIIPDKMKEYWRSTAMQLLKQRAEKGLSIWYLADERTLQREFNKRNAAIVRRNLAFFEKQPAVQLRKTETRHIISVIITDNEVLMGFRYPKERFATRGLIIRHKDFLNFFEELYDRTFENGKEFNLPSL